jgi:uncharacterized phiE125 gp8 family phage protein
MSVFLLQGPAVEPVAADDLSAWLRIDPGSDDALLQALIVSARLSLEAATARAFISQSWRLVLDAWPVNGIIPCPIGPVQSVVGARLRALDGSGQDLPTGLLVPESGAAGRPRLMLTAKPPRVLRPAGGIEIDLLVGYGAEGTAVPAPLRLAIRQLVAHWYEHRGDGAEGTPSPWPDEIGRLVAPYQARRL